MRKLLLCSAAVLGGQLALMPAAFALGGGGEGANIPVDAVQVNGLGPLSGEWDFSGGIDAYASMLTNKTPTVFNNEGTIGSNLKYSLGLAAVQISKSSGWLQFTYWGGAWQTPAIGITSDYGAFNSLARLGSGGNPLPGGPTFKWWFTVQPSQYWSVSAGELPSTEGTEIGFDWMNPTFFVSNLNNMQTTPAYGAQLNLMYGPATFNLQYSDSYKTDRFNVLSDLFTYNLNADGSDNVIVFSHTNLGHTGNPGPGFAEFNSSLVGVGAQWVAGPWTYIPEAQYQWLPKSSVTAASGNPRPQTTYYEASAMMDVSYQFNPKWSVTVQPSVTYQKGDKSDPNAQIFGNWLQFGAAANPGAFSPGMTLTAIQVDPTWQNKNVFVRPVLALTHLSGFQPGTGYGSNGNSANQFVGVLEVGVLLGKL
ncbi:MAG: hypothetical protein KGH91_04315 [Rhodospirillales bacterium]|nr:hypothetical protein [Rhodospirillales bacterium]